MQAYCGTPSWCLVTAEWWNDKLGWYVTVLSNSTPGYVHLIRTLVALISFAVVFSGSFALSTQSVEAKTLRNNSRRARDFFVPPPPPYVPSIGAWTLGMTNAQAVTADADDAVVKKPINPYSSYIFKRNQGDMSQVVQPNSHISYDPVAETRIQKHIESFDADISSVQKEIGKLLNL
ncbi:MAG: hypothetical protein P4L53_10945 [Candidatus Obscuribacterales bacterium]|nr:hypothetical protein [Candidatus Obscuribacterales bacterium]